MPKLVTTRNPTALSIFVKTNLQRYRYLASVAVPDLATGDPYGQLALYGSDESCTKALTEALDDYPGAKRNGEYERASKLHGDLADMRGLADNPVAKAFKSLGVVKPD